MDSVLWIVSMIIHQRGIGQVSPRINKEASKKIEASLSERKKFVNLIGEQ
jgi:hypothetical protein